MAETITIQYAPIDYVPITSTKKIVVTSLESILGFALMASQIITLDRFSISRENGDKIDIAACLHLPAVVQPDQAVTYTYDAYLGSLHVQFMTMDFIQSAIRTCMLLGEAQTGIISKFQSQSQPQDLSADFYLGEVKMAPFLGYDAIPLRYLESILPKVTVDSVLAAMEDCFHPQHEIYVYLPLLVTMASQDLGHEKITAICMASSYVKHLPIKYHNLNAWYLFNVCAIEKVRGRGYTKSIMISQINHLIRSGVKTFLLEVAQTNIPAQHLYSSLGFRKMETLDDGEYDIYALTTVPSLN